MEYVIEWNQKLNILYQELIKKKFIDKYMK